MNPLKKTRVGTHLAVGALGLALSLPAGVAFAHGPHSTPATEARRPVDVYPNAVDNRRSRHRRAQRGRRDYRPAPPVPRREREARRSRRGMVWAPGYWRFHAGRYAWSPGRWIRARRGFHYVPAHYRVENGRYVLQAGKWERDVRPRVRRERRPRRDVRPGVQVRVPAPPLRRGWR